MIGLEVGVVELKEHHPTWTELAQEIINPLKALLKESVLNALHIGSTALKRLFFMLQLNMMIQI